MDSSVSQQDQDALYQPTLSSPISSDGSDSSPVEYEKGIYGTTPPTGGRFGKKERQSHKQKSSKKSSGHVTFRQYERQAHSMSRVKSADWSSPISEVSEDSNSPRRYTIGDVPEDFTYTFDSAIDGDGATRGRKKKHDKDRRKQRQEKQLLKEPSLHEVPVTKSNVIPPHMREVKPSISFTETIDSSQSLSVAYLHSPSVEHGGMLSHSRIERSHSDAQLSLTLSSGQSMHCPPDRKQFYRNFAKALNIISRRQQQSIPAYHIPRQHSESPYAQNPFGHIYDELWVELRAYLNGYKSVEEQEDDDNRLHNEVDRVLDAVIHFQFCPPNQSTMDDYFHGIDDYEPILSIPSGGITLKSLKEDPPLPYYEEEEEEGPQTLTQQASTESDSSSAQNDFSRDQFLSDEQLAALHEVTNLLQDLEKIESLYPSTAKVENIKYQHVSFKRRRDALILWHKITDGIASSLARLSKWFGVAVHPVVQDESSPPLSSEPSRHGSNGSCKRLQNTDCVNPEESLALSAISGSIHTQSSLYSTGSSDYSRTTLQRLFSSRNEFSVDEDRPLKDYRRFVNQVLKKKGLPWLIDEIISFISPVLNFAEDAMIVKTQVESDSITEDERKPLLCAYLPYDHTRVTKRINSSAPRCWADEFTAMNLPPVSELYLQLTRVPLDIMQECMRLRTEVNRIPNPTPYSVGKFVQEFHMALKKAVKVRRFYRRKVHVLTINNPGGIDLIDADMASYEKHLQDVLQLYFTYVECLLRTSGTHRNLLENEWERAKEICTYISSGEVEAGLRFCQLACQIIENLEEDFKSQIDKCCDQLHERSNTYDDTDEQKPAFIESCREFKSAIQDARESSMKALGFSRTLMTDLEIAAEFSVSSNRSQILEALEASNHSQVIIPQYQSCMLFVPETIADSPLEIQQLLGVSFGRPPSNDVEDGSDIDTKEESYVPSSEHRNFYESYLLVVKFSPSESLPVWPGRNINLTLSAETIVSISEMQVEGIKLIVDNSELLDRNQMKFLQHMGSNVEITNKKTSSHHSVAERITDLKHILCHLAHTIIDVVERINSNLSVEEINERSDLLQHYQPTMQACFNLGFEYIQDLSRLFGAEFIHQKLGIEMLRFAIHWMVFVNTKCPRGHGKRPRWAALGLDFILLACSPRMLATISHTRYENVKKQMERCLDHVIGETPLQNKPLKTSQSKTKIRKKFPDRVASVQVLSHIAEQHEDKVDGSSADSSGIDSPVLSGDIMLASSYYSSLSSKNPPTSVIIPTVERVESSKYISSPSLAHTPSQDSNSSITSSNLTFDNIKEDRTKKIQEGCKQLEIERDLDLRRRRIIGQVTERSGVSVVELHKLTDIKQSHFTWRRGRKLGEGQFGVVYECINLDKGEVLAVKMISMKEKSHSTIRDILSEISVCLRINHPNIVHLSGVEIHDTDLYLFMEYCNQGTLWSAAKQGLPEKMIRIYTRDLLKAVDALHEKAIVHRDIKGANIFLSDNSVKLGDFGLCVQLQNLNKTAPQEIKHQRGTIPYMSPEVVLQQDMGRPMDIWSIGCVVVEMYTSKRPWIEYEDNALAIMYQLGQGNHPNFSVERMNSEMIDFLDKCFEPDPKNRVGANKLLSHQFVSILDDEDDTEDN